MLAGYEDPPPGMKLDDGVYYNKYMVGQKIKMPNNLIDGLVEYSDGTDSSMEQMVKMSQPFSLGSRTRVRSST